jgi:hypothetical protein
VNSKEHIDGIITKHSYWIKGLFYGAQKGRNWLIMLDHMPFSGKMGPLPLTLESIIYVKD